MTDVLRLSPRRSAPFVVGAAVVFALSLGRAASAADPESEPAAPSTQPDATTPDAAKRLTAPATAQPAWSRRPYRLKLSLGFSSDPSFTPGFREESAARIVGGLRRKLGPAARVEPVDASGTSAGTLAGIGRLTEVELTEQDDAFDQSLFVAIERNGPAYRVAARAWNGAVRRLGAVETATSFDRAGLGDEAVGLVGRQFAPLVEIVDSTDDSATLSIRAGEFSAPDPDDPLLIPGDILQPFYRHLDKQGAATRITTLPWTFLVVQSVENDTAKARIATGVRVALGAKRPRHVELLATVVRPTHPSTTLTLVPRGDRAHPLIAHPVVIEPVSFEPPPAAPAGEDPKVEASPPLARLLTDRSGRVAIPRFDAGPLVWLKIYSGEQMLAKTPHLPGLVPSDTLDLPDDSLRLSVEGDLELLKGRLVDVVARRATMIARIRSLAKSEDWKGVDEMLGRLDLLPSVKDFESQLSTIRVPALELATQRKDRLLEARVRQLTGDAQQLVTRYLDPDKIRELREELAELRSLNLKGELKEKPAGAAK